MTYKICIKSTILLCLLIALLGCGNKYLDLELGDLIKNIERLLPAEPQEK